MLRLHLILTIALTGLLFVPHNNTIAQNTPVKIILDTDLGPDSDDAGALAVLHALANKNEAEILGVVCGTTNPWCAPCADAVNTYYNRPEIPVGTLKGPGSAGGSEEWYGDSFNGYIAGHFPNRIRHGEYAEDAAHLYRRLLSTQQDSSVVIVVTGSLTNLKNLLKSHPDSLCSLPGLALVKNKVKSLSVMGGRYPQGQESNFCVDAEATKFVVSEWPTPVMFSGYEIGEEILTGPRLTLETQESNPVTAAYHLWDLQFARRFEKDFDPESGIWPHSSYDQTAVLYAVRGLKNYWKAETTGYNFIHEDGSNEWRAEPDKNHAYLIELLPREELANIIEDLMVALPKGK
ncbi:nucleoside hydrolase [candidate division KSB1 bacterium]|nr:nucleoside hydrolase [candidate division KSB1 bacterium]